MDLKSFWPREIDLPPAFPFASQVCQYPKHGPPGLGYFKGVISDFAHVDALLWRDEMGLVRGILNHYPQDFFPDESKGNVNIFIEPAAKRTGIATRLLTEAIARWGVNFEQQRFTKEGRAFTAAFLKRTRVQDGASK